jgi:hypothetical protein
MSGDRGNIFSFSFLTSLPSFLLWATVFYLLVAGAAARDRDVDLDKYVGKHPDRQFLALTAVHDPLAKLLGKRLDKFLRALEVTAPMEQVGRDLVASGCMAHNCTVEQSAFAIDLDSGKVVAASITEGKYFDIYSNGISNYDDLPPGIRHWISSRTSQSDTFRKMRFRFMK